MHRHQVGVFLERLPLTLLEDDAGVVVVVQLELLLGRGPAASGARERDASRGLFGEPAVAAGEPGA